MRDNQAPSNQTSETAHPHQLSYGERLSLFLQANWAAFPEGDWRRIPPLLVFEMMRDGNHDILPALLEEYHPSLYDGLVPAGTPYTEKELKFRAVCEVMQNLRYLQFYGEAPVFTGISDDAEKQKYARYFWMIYRVYDKLTEEGDEFFPGLKADFSSPSMPYSYWAENAPKLPFEDRISKSAGRERRHHV
jgi:hypothetical protein